MKDYTVKDFMVSTAKLVTIPENAKVHDAVEILEQAQRELPPEDFRHRVMVVVDKQGEFVGKLSLLDIIAGLEPKYAQVKDFKLSRFGLTQQMLKTIFEQHGLWENSLATLCKRADRILVKDIMDSPEESELVHENESLSFAIHQFATGRHHNLMVHNATGKITGLLRLVDVYGNIRKMLAECRVEGS
ncbi:MAG: CBS domain-containing protein [Proteobacteria bacterium]|nr:CBS domain-containing protein [Pseudomonadota bacterium]